MTIKGKAQTTFAQKLAAETNTINACGNWLPRANSMQRDARLVLPAASCQTRGGQDGAESVRSHKKRSSQALATGLSTAPSDCLSSC